MGHHTTTKVARTQRPDTRPNESRRRRAQAKAADAQKIQEIRVTKTQKADKKERELQKMALRDTAQVSEEKYVRALKKKLKDIDLLLARQKKGETMDKQQLAKIETLDSVMEAMETALAKSATAAGEEMDEEEEEEEEEDET